MDIIGTILLVIWTNWKLIIAVIIMAEVSAIRINTNKMLEIVEKQNKKEDN